MKKGSPPSASEPGDTGGLCPPAAEGRPNDVPTYQE
jgi:hypothetical protein